MDNSTLIRQILNPQAQHAEELLADLDLAGLPSQAKVHEQIEQNLLLPKSRLPDHWLPTYQL